MALLFINAFKGLRKKKVQMIAIITLVMLSSCIYTVINTALDTIENRYDEYLKEQNVEDFSFSLNIDYEKEFNREEVQELIDGPLKDLPEEQMNLVKQYQMTLGVETDQDLSQLYQTIDYIFQMNGALESLLDKKVEYVANKLEFDYQVEQAKITTEDEKIYKGMVYDKDNKKEINIPYLIEGKMPEKKNEITMMPKFAERNNLKIGDIYYIGEKEYEIVGYAYSPDHIYPIISMNMPIFQEDKNCVMFMTPETYKEFTGSKEVAYIASFHDENKKIEAKELIDTFEENDDLKLSFTTVGRLMRTQMLEAEIESDRTFSEYFLYLLLGISVFIILVVTKKRIEDERLQIGVLKSLGYNSISIAISYLVYPLLGGIIGGLIGWGIAMCAYEYVLNLYLSYFALPVTNVLFDTKYLLVSVLGITSVLVVLTFAITLIMLRKRPLELLKEGSNLKVNWLNKIISFITRKLSFDKRFKYSLASRSFGKLFIVSLTSFCSGLLIVLILIGVNLFSSMIMKTFDGLEFDYMVSYTMPKQGRSKDEDLVYEKTMNAIAVRKQSEDYGYKELKFINDRFDDKDFSVTLDGIETRTKYINLINENSEKLQSKLKEDGIVINNNIKELLNVEVGDIIVFEKDEDEEIELEVLDITDAFMGNMVYISRTKLCELFEVENLYNIKYTNDSKYGELTTLDKTEADEISSVFSIKDLKNNMVTQLKTVNGVIYIIISFAALMVLIIISVIANIVVEENKKTISLMKVMGYKNKRICNVVLNIYTPFVIGSYLISIPVMQGILKAIVKALMKDMDMAIPIEFSVTKAIIGLVALLVAYYISIAISRRTLNKVPLSVALKRE